MRGRPVFRLPFRRVDSSGGRYAALPSLAAQKRVWKFLELNFLNQPSGPLSDEVEERAEAAQRTSGKLSPPLQ